MTKLLQVLENVAKVTFIFAAFCAFSLAFLILVDVLARLFSIKFYGVAEYVRNMIIVIVFLQLPFAIRIASMLRVDVFTSMMPKVLQVPLYTLGNLLGVLFSHVRLKQHLQRQFPGFAASTHKAVVSD